jgi:acyl carrier protein
MDRLVRITELVAQVAKKTIRIGADENLFDAGLIDSFGLTDLVALLEAEYGFKVPDEDLNPRKFSTLEKIDDYVGAHV